MEKVKHKIIVMSGKGGVGKSTVAVNLARMLEHKGKHVGILDVDLCGPSIPKLTGLDGRQLFQSSSGWVPVYTESHLQNTISPSPSSSPAPTSTTTTREMKGMAVVSVQFLLDSQDTPVIWRGPKKTGMINQFVNNVNWGETMDYLIIDTPPGTSDEHIAVLEYLQKHGVDGAVLVTTPQEVSISDVRKEISFCKSGKIPILGIFENMSGFVCPHCSECTNIFSSEGGKLLAEDTDVPFLGKLPIDPQLTQACEKGQNYVKMNPTSTSLLAISLFCDDLIQKENK
eukprot:TRINITY_DN322_c2_g1_i1.p1 TRINITY_DN322_c2_g1~~TRINITY_DN322_c2_g1_i1.p1  ORF type:complete len:285 (-),score=76.64 TRINITY_DN322_c2_g1_i1:67-921(-)